MQGDIRAGAAIYDDWAQNDRAAALKRMHSAPLSRAAQISSAECVASCVDRDPRSVRANLAGQGDLRATVWCAFSWAYGRLFPARGLEGAMCAFHQLHQAVQLARLEFRIAVDDVAGVINQDGLVAACDNAFRRMSRH